MDKCLIPNVFLTLFLGFHPDPPYSDHDELKMKINYLFKTETNILFETLNIRFSQELHNINRTIPIFNCLLNNQSW